MKSLQNYISTYRSIANKLNITGDSAELLIQLLANASYISEVENIVYSQEASLERATLINSKIQQCVDIMYSVFRGQCPRIILNIKALKPIKFEPYNNIITLNNLKLYYLGYYDSDKDTKEGVKNFESGFQFDELIINSPGDNYKILCLLAPDKKTREFSLDNLKHYIEIIDEEDISNDLRVFLDNNSIPVTRHFADHILNGDAFDLTIPGFSSRIYFMKDENSSANSTVNLEYFKLTKLSSYNMSELKKINLKGTELIPFDSEEDILWKKERGLTIENDINTGILGIPEVGPDSYINLHYKANQNRYLNTIFRSSEDLGNLLKEYFPKFVLDTRTSYDNINTDSSIVVYYIPNSGNLSATQIEEFIRNRKSYYVSEDINILSGERYDVTFDITVKLYENDKDNSTSDSIINILENYNKKFGINFIVSETSDVKLIEESVTESIKTLISKLTNVKCIDKFNIKYSDESGNIFEEDPTDDFYNIMLSDLIQERAYFIVKCNISTII